MRSPALALALVVLAGCVQTPDHVTTAIAYDRAAFSGWVDTDGDCRNTRAEMLIAASTEPVELRHSGCTVASGAWLDPYTGRSFSDASDVQIDHLVPLAWAWRRGASEWPERKADRFALDPDNLRIVSASEDQAKSAQGPLEWLPPDRGYHCTYVSEFRGCRRGVCAGAVTDRGAAASTAAGKEVCQCLGRDDGEIAQRPILIV